MQVTMIFMPNTVAQLLPVGDRNPIVLLLLIKLSAINSEGLFRQQI